MAWFARVFLVPFSFFLSFSQSPSLNFTHCSCHVTYYYLDKSLSCFASLPLSLCVVTYKYSFVLFNTSTSTIFLVKLRGVHSLHWVRSSLLEKQGTCKPLASLRSSDATEHFARAPLLQHGVLTLPLLTQLLNRVWHFMR